MLLWLGPELQSLSDGINEMYSSHFWMMCVIHVHRTLALKLKENMILLNHFVFTIANEQQSFVESIKRNSIEN